MSESRARHPEPAASPGAGGKGAESGRLEGEEARRAALWLDELRRRLDQLWEEMPQDFGVPFECWVERYLDLSEQISLLERMLDG